MHDCKTKTSLKMRLLELKVNAKKVVFLRI